MPECPRCGGLWVERDEESYCAICGNRTMPDHPFCFLGDSTIEERTNKRKARMCFEKRRNPQRMDTNKRKPGRPRGSKKKTPVLNICANENLEPNEEMLKALPREGPIKEHPYILFLAEKWEALDAQIEPFRNEQKELEQAAQDFEKKYSSDT